MAENVLPAGEIIHIFISPKNSAHKISRLHLRGHFEARGRERRKEKGGSEGRD